MHRNALYDSVSHTGKLMSVCVGSLWKFHYPYESISRLLVVSKCLSWPTVNVILICLCSEVGNTSELAAWISGNI